MGFLRCSVDGCNKVANKATGMCKEHRAMEEKKDTASGGPVCAKCGEAGDLVRLTMDVRDGTGRVYGRGALLCGTHRVNPTSKPECAPYIIPASRVGDPA